MYHPLVRSLRHHACGFCSLTAFILFFLSLIGTTAFTTGVIKASLFHDTPPVVIATFTLLGIVCRLLAANRVVDTDTADETTSEWVTFRPFYHNIVSYIHPYLDWHTLFRYEVVAPQYPLWFLLSSLVSSRPSVILRLPSYMLNRIIPSMSPNHLASVHVIMTSC